MTAIQFPDIDEAKKWYTTTQDGLAGLWVVAGSKAGHQLSEEVLDALYGLSEREWQDFYREQKDRHEMFATLALFAACEGGIRRDFEWRSEGNFGQQHHQRFYALKTSSSRPNHIPLGSIMDEWKAAFGRGHWMRKYLECIMGLFSMQRNALAHGKPNASAYVFLHIYRELDAARQKWRSAIGDFRGY